MRQENPFLGIHLFFLFYSFLQSLLEVSLFVILASFFKKWGPNWLFQLFIALSFIVLLAHYTDFTLLRLMDTSFSYIYKFFFGSGIDHLLTAFLALNMNPFMIAVIALSLILVPLMGIGFYSFTHSWSMQKPWRLSFKQMGLSLGAISMSLLLLDCYAYPRLNRLAYEKYEKALPLGTTFLSPSPKFYELEKPLPVLRSEELITKTIQSLPQTFEKLPNLYFFIIETLRSDFVTPNTAPHLSTFLQKNISFSETFANANYTNLSWFALLHSAFPHNWTKARDSYQEGSAPLRILQKLGYKIRIYSSSDLSYFQMQKTLFGQKNQLIDHLEQYTDNRELEPCERDQLAMQAFARDIDKHCQNTVFLFFFDSTHSEYSFPKNFPLKFEPISERISYLTISKKSPDLELLKNRYRNSIAYVDTLLGSFFSLLHAKGLYEESLIAITGDHGEEFFEEGSLFHGTHLNRYQTSVPIGCKLGKNDWMEKLDLKRKTMSHVDLFPSIIHYLTRTNDLAPLFDGQSIFGEAKRPYHLSVLQNGPNSPQELCIEWGPHKMNLRLAGPNTVEVLESDIPIDLLKNIGI